MTEYERGFRAGIEAAASIHDAWANDDSETDRTRNSCRGWARLIRSLSPSPSAAPAPHFQGIPVISDGRPVGPLVDAPPRPSPGSTAEPEELCPRCKGRGEYVEREDMTWDCPRCDGTGRVSRKAPLRREGFDDERPIHGCADALGLKRMPVPEEDWPDTDTLTAMAEMLPEKEKP